MVAKVTQETSATPVYVILGVDTNMKPLETDRLDELQALVTQLGAALTLSERRTARLERIIRWTALGTTLVLGLAVLMLVQPLAPAIAQQQAATSPSTSVEQAIDRLTMSLTGERSTIGMVGQMLYEMMSVGTKTAMAEARQIPTLSDADCAPGAQLSAEVKAARINHQLGFYAKCFFVENGITAPSPQDYQRAVMAAASGTAVDLGVLVARVRDDSDLIRRFVNDYVGDSKALMQQIGGQLALLNKTLESVPVMTASVNTMTHQMGIMTADMSSMSHSMGSTMGRMGKWMPW